MTGEQPQTQPQPPERPVFNPETLKEEIAGTDRKIDTLNETLETIKKAKKEALEDIKTDIAKVYPDDTEEAKTKRTQEYAAVEKMLGRLEKSYLQTAKEGLYEFEDIADMYFKELQTITGDTNPEEGNVDLSTVDPYAFWKESAGWYERAPQDFKEEKIEKESDRWQETVYSFQEGTSNKIKGSEKENFQNWIEAHREDLRRVILKQTADRKYVIDFTNLSKNFTGAMADNVRAADFIAKNIGLADLFADISQAVTVWKGDKLYTGTLNKDFDRKNGLKGGYFYNDKYLEIWHGAVISTNPDDQIAENEEDFLPVEMFEAPKEDEQTKEKNEKKRNEDEIEITQQKGGRVINLAYKPGVDENDTPNENLKVIIKENAEKRQKELDKESSGLFKLNYSYEKLYEVGTIKKEGETTFKLDTTTPDYSNINNEITYSSKEFPNIEIVIPFSKNSGYLLRVKTQEKVTIYEFADVESLKVQLGKEVETQEKNARNSIPREEVKTMELSESCSAETTKSQIKKAKERYTENKKTSLTKIIIKGEIPTELEPQNEKTKITIKNSELTEEGVKKLPIDGKVTNVNIEAGENLSRESLDTVLSKTPKATRLSLKESKDLYEGALFTVASRLNRTLEELDLSYSAVNPEELQYLDSCTKLRILNLSYTAVDNFAVETYISGLGHLESLDLSSTEITDKSLESLAKLENLTHLNLKGTDTSFKATLELKKKLPRLYVEISERAEKELEKLLKEKIEELIKKREPEIEEDIREILGYKSDENISIQNTEFDYNKKSITTDIYFENQKITSANLTIKITDENDDEISPEKLYEQLFVSGNLDTKPETKEASGNKLKRKVTIGKIIVYMEKKYEFSELDKDNKEKSVEIKDIAKKIDDAKKDKKQKEYLESMYKNHSDHARKVITQIFGEKGPFINFETTEILRKEEAIHGKLTYKGENIGQIRMCIGREVTELYDDNGEGTTKNFMLTKIKDIDDRKKAEEDAKAAQEAVAKLNKQKKETIENLNRTLANIDGNLKINDSTTKDSTVEKGRKYLELTITYFGEKIGRIRPWADVPIAEQIDSDIWVEVETEERFEQIKEGNLQERLGKLKEKVLEKKRDKKIEEFKKIIEEANKEIFGKYYAGDQLLLDSEELKTIKYSETEKRPHITAKIYLQETYADPSGGDAITTTKTIGSISDWIIGTSKTGIFDKNGETITEGSTIIEKLEKLKEKED